MAIQKMKLVKISGPTDALDKFIRECCLDGTFQPESAVDFLPKKGFSTLSGENPYTPLIQMIHEINKEFSVDIKHEKAEKLFDSKKDYEYLKHFYDKVHSNFEARAELQKKLENNQTLVENYEHFAEMDINLKDIFDCEFTKFRFGYLPRESYEKLQMNVYKDNPFITFIKGKEVKDGYWGAYVVPASKKEEIENIFTKLSFEKAFVPSYNGNAEQAIAEIVEHNKEIEAQIDALTKELTTFIEGQTEHYSLLVNRIYALNKAFELRSYAAIKSEDNTFFYVGWITEDAQDSFEKKLAHFKHLNADYETPSASVVEKVPVKLKNCALFRPFSYFVEMFGLPSYNESDPTPLFAITYALMFGLMFADLGQGFVIIIIGYLMHKFKKMPLGQILMRCGVFSCIFGAVFGSVFGIEDMLDGVYEKLGIHFLPVKVFENTTSILILAISCGVVLMLLVMLINTINCFRLKRYADAIFGANGIAGLLVYTALVYFATNMMANAEVKTALATVPPIVLLVMLFVGVALLFMHEFVLEKSLDKNYKLQPGNYFLSNFIELFESILSFFSNTVSYLRLGAFVLVHAGMMMVVTTLAGDKVSVTYIIVMILGNALVIALEALLTGIQSLRLEFYEMFSRYYSGQGKAFEPVCIDEFNE
ncbi:MAG: hypothetical protein IKE65_02580 [Clostridia bacterium]|nr:hypothetical protein [Clostridia bacterium]